MQMVDLLSDFKALISKEIVPGSQEPEQPQYVWPSAFDAFAEGVFRNINQAMVLTQNVKQIWLSKTAGLTFGLEKKVEFVSELQHTVNNIKQQVADLKKRVLKGDFEHDSIYSPEFQKNVCECFLFYMNTLICDSHELYMHAQKLKRERENIVGSHNHSQEVVMPSLDQVLKNVDPKYKEQTLQLLKVCNNETKQFEDIAKSLLEVKGMVQQIHMHALQQQGMAIQFSDNNSLAVENVRSGKKQLANANKNQGETGQYWMWFFLTLTIMIVILDFAKN